MARQFLLFSLGIFIVLLCACSSTRKTTTKSPSDPCMEAIRLRKQAEQSTSEDRGILEAKAAAMQDICNKRQGENARQFDESQRRHYEHKKEKK